MRTSDAARLLQALALLVLAVAAMVAALRLPVYEWDGKAVRFHRLTGEVEVAGEEGWRSVPAAAGAATPEADALRIARAAYSRFCQGPGARLTALEYLQGPAIEPDCALLRVRLDAAGEAEREQALSHALAATRSIGQAPPTAEP